MALESTDCVAVLRAVDIFADFPQEFLSRLATVAEVRTYSAGDSVVSEHEPATAFFVVTRGRLEVFRSDVDGGRTAVAVIAPPQFFGEMALLHEGTRLATVRAAEASECVVLERSAFEAEMRRDPNAAAVLATRLARRLNALMGRGHARLDGKPA
jgi:CRP-like cAMP-binding protein